MPGPRILTSWLPSWKYDVISEIRHRQSKRIYLKNNPAKFHPDAIRNDGALDVFNEGEHQELQDEQQCEICSWSKNRHLLYYSLYNHILDTGKF